MPRLFLFSLGLCLICLACKPSLQKNIDTTRSTKRSGILAVIEIPAGTNTKLEYDKVTRKFEAERIEGRDRSIDFLPYPGNYGFIPDTWMDTTLGGDGDALDVLVLSAQLETGTLLEVLPIGALVLKDGGELDTKIIAVPADSTLRVMKALDFLHFSVDYQAAREIIELWFLNYKGLGETEMLGWRDERFAAAEIKKWRVKEVPQ